MRHAVTPAQPPFYNHKCSTLGLFLVPLTIRLSHLLFHSFRLNKQKNTLDLMMEIVIQVSHTWIQLFFNMGFELLSQHLLAILANRQKIDKKYTLIILYDFVHVPVVNFMGQLIPTVYLSRRRQTYLLEKDRNTSADLQVTDEKLIEFYDLLSFTKISHKALLVQPSIKISGPSLLIAPPRDQQVAELSALEEDIKAFGKALNDGALPFEV